MPNSNNSKQILEPEPGADKAPANVTYNNANNQKLFDDYESSSEDEPDLDEKTIIHALFQYYKTHDDDSHIIRKTANSLENVLHSGVAACLICIGSLRRTDSIWSCRHCYCIFHLNCIRRWANDSLAQLRTLTDQQQRHNQGHFNHLGEYIPPKRPRPLFWRCPQCREEYNPDECPYRYLCFCGKELNPPIQSWLVPHSCGEICDKQLKPDCGHRCMLLCHPGPCPPCAQYTDAACLCGKSPQKSVRCVQKTWQCYSECKAILPCGEHRCNQLCHKPGSCPPCSSTSVQPCECGRESKLRSCSDLKWRCENVCGQKYPCGIHNCRKVCHAGDCGQCPLGLPRSCPCGKTKKLGPCTEVIDTCGDTCQKLLACGIHTCTQRCHRGNCNACLHIVKKKCRCGMHEKEVVCSKDFVCETKCKQMRDCGKHACSRKCCDGCCPSCDKICGKPLNCKKHKCQSVCHEGPCYPCKLQTQVNCRCQKTSKSVACGRERSARITCLERCRIQSKCHHPTNHRCHKHECPPCNQMCGQLNINSGCGHRCAAKCHAAVKQPRNYHQGNRMTTFISLPHPTCEQKVKVMCIGGHETTTEPCWNAKPLSCQHACNRQLRCGNHRCAAICHAVPYMLDMMEQEGCASCQEGCNKPRPPGCIHPCPRACHATPCPPCHAIIKTKCHCSLTLVIYKCAQFYSTEGGREQIMKRQELLKSCGSRCLKNFPCGHRCTNICHSGDCRNPESCRKKVRIYCECKRLKSEVSCDKHRAGLTSMKCDENCAEARTKLDLLQKEEAERQRAQEAIKNRMEVEQFEKKFTKRKPKVRKVLTESGKKQINWQSISIGAGIVLAVAIAIAVAFYADN